MNPDLRNRLDARNAHFKATTSRYQQMINAAFDWILGHGPRPMDMEDEG